MAPGGQTRCSIFCHQSFAPLTRVYHWTQKVLSIRFCYQNSLDAVARALGLSCIPCLLTKGSPHTTTRGYSQHNDTVCVICGVVALFFGGFRTLQGILALATAVLLLVLEKPLAPKTLLQVRRHPLKRAFFYMVFVHHHCHGETL